MLRGGSDTVDRMEQAGDELARHGILLIEQSAQPIGGTANWRYGELAVRLSGGTAKNAIAVLIMYFGCEAVDREVKGTALCSG